MDPPTTLVRSKPRPKPRSKAQRKPAPSKRKPVSSTKKAIEKYREKRDDSDTTYSASRIELKNSPLLSERPVRVGQNRWFVIRVSTKDMPGRNPLTPPVPLVAVYDAMDDALDVSREWLVPMAEQVRDAVAKRKGLIFERVSAIQRAHVDEEGKPTAIFTEVEAGKPFAFLKSWPQKKREARKTIDKNNKEFVASSNRDNTMTMKRISDLRKKREAEREHIGEEGELGTVRETDEDVPYLSESTVPGGGGGGEPVPGMGETKGSEPETVSELAGAGESKGSEPETVSELAGAGESKGSESELAGAGESKGSEPETVSEAFIKEDYEIMFSQKAQEKFNVVDRLIASGASFAKRDIDNWVGAGAVVEDLPEFEAAFLRKTFPHDYRESDPGDLKLPAGIQKSRYEAVVMAVVPDHLDPKNGPGHIYLLSAHETMEAAEKARDEHQSIDPIVNFMIAPLYVMFNPFQVIAGSINVSHPNKEIEKASREIAETDEKVKKENTEAMKRGYMEAFAEYMRRHHDGSLKPGVDHDIEKRFIILKE